MALDPAQFGLALGRTIGDGLFRLQEREDLLARLQQEQANFQQQMAFREQSRQDQLNANLQDLVRQPGVAPMASFPAPATLGFAAPQGITPAPAALSLPGTDLGFSRGLALDQNLAEARALEQLKQQAALDALKNRIDAFGGIDKFGQGIPVKDPAGTVIGHNILDPLAGDITFAKSPAPPRKEITVQRGDGSIGVEVLEAGQNLPPDVKPYVAPQRPERTSALRKELGDDDVVKQFRTINEQIGRLEKAMQANATGKNKVAVDQTLITVLNKMLDPSSVVRESEYARTPENLSILNRLKGKIDKLTQGGAGLTDEDRTAIYQMARNFYEVSRTKAGMVVQQFRDIAQAGGHDASLIIPRDVEEALAPRQGQQQSTQAVSHPQDSEAVNWARQNPNDPRSAQILKANGL